MMSSNLERLKIIAEGLGKLKSLVAFVGGAVVELYADNPAATEIRMTEDVDCVVKLSTYHEFYELEKQLRIHGFSNSTTPGDPICRWIYKGETVDIMPDDKNVLGFTNEWYRPAFTQLKEVRLPNGTCINIFSPLYYIATKIEAIKSRGGNDYRFSHDFEDLIYVLNNSERIKNLFDKETDSSLKTYLSNWMTQALDRQNIREEIECALPYGDQQRMEYVLELLRYFSKGNLRIL